MKRVGTAVLLGLASVLAACGGRRSPTDVPPVATFSIVGYEPRTKTWGIAVQSRFLAVGSVVPWARAGAGAIATQAWANVAYGPDGLERLAAGETAAAVVEALTEADEGRDRRQLGIVDAAGQAAAFTGAGCTPWAGHEVGTNFCAQGNILKGPEVVAAMARAFEEHADRKLADRLLAALEAGQAAGGDRRGKQSAALYLVRAGGGYDGGNDRFVDLRVDDDEAPIARLRHLLKLHKAVWTAEHAK